MLVSTHLPPQSTAGSTHVQAPATQVVPPVQATPQPPQFSPFVRMSTQAPAQLVSVKAPSDVHALAEHTCSGVHATSHPPQLAGSRVVSTQTPLQGVVPTGHSHTDDVQTCPPVHTRPQDPQLWSF